MKYGFHPEAEIEVIGILGIPEIVTRESECPVGFDSLIFLV